LSGRKVFTAGEVLQAADVNDYLMDQSVMVFAGTAARGSAIPSPTEGMVTYRSDDDVVEVFDGSSFIGVGGAPAILQVVQDELTTPFTASLAQGAEATLTGLSATITPSATSSKVLVMVTLSAGNTLSIRQEQFFALFRDTTRVGVGDAAGSRKQVSSGNGLASQGNAVDSMSMTFLDTPATTSAISYTVKISHDYDGTDTVLINRSSTDADSSRSGRAISTITLMEVAG